MTNSAHVPHRAPVTVLVPTFNRAHYLGQALDSLLRQSVPPAEVIVIDDGSDDDTAAVVAGYGNRIAYLRQENSGKATALNRGLEQATQPFVWIFDDDDIAAKDTLASLYSALLKADHAGFAYGLCDKFAGEWPASARECNQAYRSDDHRALYIRLMEDFFLWQGAMLVRRSCYEATGPFDTRLNRSQDYQMALRLVRFFPVIAVPIVAFHQRHHDGQRGPKKALVDARKVDAAWATYNEIIFDELHASHDLEEFCVGGSDPLKPREQITGLIQRGCIMARKALWDLAREDFRLAAALAQVEAFDALNEQERAALRRVFQRGSRAAFDDARSARLFFEAIDRFPKPLRSAIRGNLLLPLSYRLRRISQAPYPRDEMRQIWLAGRHLLGATVLNHYIDARRTDRGMFGVQPLVAA